MSITLTTMRYFLEVAKYENFSVAAARLYTAQPNLSKTISGLERSLGVELFYREGRYVRLTDAGRLLKKEWSAALELIDQSILQARQIEHATSETLKLGILEGLSFASHAPEWFGELQKISPGIKLRLERGGMNSVWQKFEAKKYDMIAIAEFHDTPRALPPACVRRVLSSCCGAIAINVNNPLARESGLTLSMLAEESFVVMSQEESPEGYRTIRETCLRAGFEPRVAQEADSIETLLLYVEMGVGVAILGLNNRLTTNTNIQLIPLEDIMLDIAIYWHDDSVSPAIRSLLGAFGS